MFNKKKEMNLGVGSTHQPLDHLESLHWVLCSVCLDEIRIPICRQE